MKTQFPELRDRATRISRQALSLPHSLYRCGLESAFLLCGRGCCSVGLLLDIREAEQTELEHILLDVLEEVLGDHLLCVVLRVVELGVAVLARYDCRAVLLLLEVQLVLDKDVLAEVARQVASLDDVDHEVDASIE